MVKPRVVLLIFVNGKLVMTGARTREDLQEALDNIYPILRSYKKQWKNVYSNPSFIHPMDAKGSFAGSKVWSWPHLHPVLSIRTSGTYLQFPIHIHDVVIQGCLHLYFYKNYFFVSYIDICVLGHFSKQWTSRLN